MTDYAAGCQYPYLTVIRLGLAFSSDWPHRRWTKDYLRQAGKIMRKVRQRGSLNTCVSNRYEVLGIQAGTAD